MQAAQEDSAALPCSLRHISVYEGPGLAASNKSDAPFRKRKWDFAGGEMSVFLVFFFFFPALGWNMWE